MTTQGKALALLNFARLRACDPGDVGDLARAWLAVREQPATFELQFDTQIGEESPRPIVVQTGGDADIDLRADHAAGWVAEGRLGQATASLLGQAERLTAERDEYRDKLLTLDIARQTEIDALQSDVERLTAEIDSVQAASLTMIDRLTAECTRLKERLVTSGGRETELRTRVERLTAEREVEFAGRRAKQRRAEVAEANLDRLTAERDVSWPRCPTCKGGRGDE